MEGIEKTRTAAPVRCISFNEHKIEHRFCVCVDAREVCVMENCRNESGGKAGDQTSYGHGKVLVRVQCSTECTASKNPEASTQSRRGL